MAPHADEQDPDRGEGTGAGATGAGASGAESRDAQDRAPQAQQPPPPAAPGQGVRPPEAPADAGVPSPTIPRTTESLTDRPSSETPRQQESQPPPSLQRWAYGAGGAVVVLAIIWALLRASTL